MSATEADARSFRRRFILRTALPTLSVAALAKLAVPFTVCWIAAHADSTLADRQQRLATQLVQNAVEDLARRRGGIAAGALPAAEPGHGETYVLDPSGQPVYASVGGSRVADAGFEAVRPSLAPALALMRDRLRRAGPAPAPGAVEVSGVVGVLGRLAIVSMTTLPSPLPGVPGGVVIDLQDLDAGFLRSLSERYLLASLRLSWTQDVRPGESALPLADPSGRPSGYLAWRPERLAGSVLRSLAPLAIGATALFGAAVALLVRSLWRINRAQFETLDTLTRSEARLRHQSLHDGLTGLANRSLFEQRLAEMAALPGSRFALLLIDLDHFKQVNDTLGHHAGDELLNGVARRLCRVFGPDSVVARLGCDEFGVLADAVAGQPEVDALCAQLHEQMRLPIAVEGGRLVAVMSIGTALAPLDARDPNELLRKADLAARRAKADGGNRACRFTGELEARVGRQRVLEAELRRALAGGTELAVHYQPEVAARTGTIVGFEALLRWKHPTEGFIPPQDFIEVAEEAGLIGQIGLFVLAQAARVASRWPDLFFSVNLSPLQLRMPGFAATAIDAVRAAGSAPGRIELEITEGVLLGSDEVTRRSLASLRAAGFPIALDDFGIGYSSLSYLRRLHVDKIKIDRTFTEHVESDGHALAIVTCLVTLGRMIDVVVTAEGVETAGQMQVLRDAGCDELQGYLFSPAVPEGELPGLLEAPPAGRRRLPRSGLPAVVDASAG